ncbi:MAG: hypothetical protein HY907_08985 [Deltaproteobacteria bacterium]|nr:hypothetical protein [Deltaproteobacteria bacterium]
MPDAWMKRAARRSPELAAAMLALFAIAAVWLPAELPMVDLPEHRAIAAELTGLRADPPDPAVTPFHAERGPSALYGASYYRLAAWADRPGAVARLELSLALIAWVAGALALARRLRGSARLASLAAPLYFGLAWHWGFLPWLVALPALPWVLWAAAALRERPADGKPRFGRWAVLLGTLTFAAVTHLALAAVAWLGVTVLLWPRDLRLPALGRWAARTVLVALPAAALAAAQLVSGRPRVPLSARPTEWPAVLERLRGLLDWSVPGPHFWLGALFLGLVAVLALAELLGTDPSGETHGGDAVDSRRRLRVFAGLLGLACLFLPRQAGDLHFAAERLVVPLLLVLFAAVAGVRGVRLPRLPRSTPTFAWLAAVAVAAGVLVAQLSASIGFSAEVGNIDRIADLIPRGSRVLVLPIDVRSDAILREVPFHLHTASRVIERRGGIISIPPLANVGLPVEPTAAGRRALVVPEWGQGILRSLLQRLAEWDFVLVYARGGFPSAALAPLARRVRPVLPPEHSGGPYAGPWYLMETTGR